MYAKDFYVAWKYVPWLTIAIVFGAMSGYIGGIFAAVKDSKIFAKSTVCGAITNVILNLILTPLWDHWELLLLRQYPILRYGFLDICNPGDILGLGLIYLGILLLISCCFVSRLYF